MTWNGDGLAIAAGRPVGRLVRYIWRNSSFLTHFPNRITLGWFFLRAGRFPSGRMVFGMWNDRQPQGSQERRCNRRRA